MFPEAFEYGLVARLPAGYAGGVFTNEIEAVASWLKPGRPAAP